LALRNQETSPERRRRILAAARRLILKQGLRATTMEAIAREAGIAKPTLYAYFADKDAVFRGIADELAAAVRVGFNAALEADGDAVTRIGNGLAAKYRIIARLLDNSPHAEALFGAHERSAAPALVALEGQVEAAIVGVLASAGCARPRPLTQLLLASAHGVGRRAGAAEVGPAIRLLAERLLRPEFSRG
jgi:AcrR family transcriptional regulator